MTWNSQHQRNRRRRTNSSLQGRLNHVNITRVRMSRVQLFVIVSKLEKLKIIELHRVSEPMLVVRRFDLRTIFMTAKK